METALRRSESTVVAGGVALALAGCGGLSLAVGQAVWVTVHSQGSESVVVLLSVVGVMLLVWAAVVDGFVAVDLIGALVSRDRPALVEVALVVATAVVIAGVVWAHPLVGNGVGVAEPAGR